MTTDTMTDAERCAAAGGHPVGNCEDCGTLHTPWSSHFNDDGSAVGQVTTAHMVRCLTCREVMPADRDCVHEAEARHDGPVLFEEVTAFDEVGSAKTIPDDLKGKPLGEVIDHISNDLGGGWRRERPAPCTHSTARSPTRTPATPSSKPGSISAPSAGTSTGWPQAHGVLTQASRANGAAASTASSTRSAAHAASAPASRRRNRRCTSRQRSGAGTSPAEAKLPQGGETALGVVPAAPMQIGAP